MPEIQTASTDAELLPIVNELDEPIGALPRRQVHLEKHLHRAVQICVFDGAGRVVLQQRSHLKDTYALWWDWACTGHVDPGEDYETAVRRELREELGIDVSAGDARPEFMFKHQACERTGWEFQSVYALRWSETIHFNPNEIERLVVMSPEELSAAIAETRADFPLTPGVVVGWPLMLRALRPE